MRNLGKLNTVFFFSRKFIKHNCYLWAIMYLYQFIPWFVRVIFKAYLVSIGRIHNFSVTSKTSEGAKEKVQYLSECILMPWQHWIKIFMPLSVPTDHEQQGLRRQNKTTLYYGFCASYSSASCTLNHVW